MQNDKASEIMKSIKTAVKKKMGNESTYFITSNVNDDPNHKSFQFEFLAYDYFWVGIEYDKGLVTAYINSGENKVEISLEDWWEKIILSDWIEQLDSELRLRIPDKYLDAKGWNNKSNIVPSSEEL